MGFGKIVLLGGVIALALGGGWPLPEGAGPWGAALAQDDDDGGDDDDDDDNPPRTAPKPAAPAPVKPAPAPAPAPSPTPTPAPARAPAQAAALPDRAPGEIVALGLSGADLARLLDQGFVLIEARALPGVRPAPGDELPDDGPLLLRRLAQPPGLTPEAARDLVRALPSGQNADFNHFYRSQQEAQTAATPPCAGPHCAAFDQVAWPVPPSRQSCGAPALLGMIDTALNPAHSTFAGADLTVLPLADPDPAAAPTLVAQSAPSLPAPPRDPSRDPSGAQHGTAVAALLIGDPSSRSPGLVPSARLVAIDAFHRDSGDERADVAALITALDQLAAAGVRVINLSLAGPPNTVLQETIRHLVQDRAITLVAAAGNGGPAAPPAYPAAYPGVLAVTAVDGAARVYRRAAQGPHIGLAAPGVEVWTAASVKGARSKSGTSFAAPFVTAAAALLLQADPALTPAGIAERLQRGARDLGAPGPDPVFGHGLVQLSALCPP